MRTGQRNNKLRQKQRKRIKLIKVKGNKIFATCPTCGVVASRRVSHIKRATTVAALFTCPKCEESFVGEVGK